MMDHRGREKCKLQVEAIPVAKTCRHDAAKQCLENCEELQGLMGEDRWQMRLERPFG